MAGNASIVRSAMDRKAIDPDHDESTHVVHSGQAPRGPAERRILDLRLEDNTSPEISTLTGLSSVNIRVRLTRLRQRLHAAGVAADWL